MHLPILAAAEHLRQNGLCFLFRQLRTHPRTAADALCRSTAHHKPVDKAIGIWCGASGAAGSPGGSTCCSGGVDRITAEALCSSSIQTCNAGARDTSLRYCITAAHKGWLPVNFSICVTAFGVSGEPCSAAASSSDRPVRICSASDAFAGGSGCCARSEAGCRAGGADSSASAGCPVGVGNASHWDTKAADCRQTARQRVVCV
jgi:hypothetical protein